MSTFGNTLRGLSRSIFGSGDPFNDPKVRNFTRNAPQTVKTLKNVQTILNLRRRRGVGMAPNTLGVSPYTDSNLALPKLPSPILERPLRPNRPKVIIDPSLSLARQKQNMNNLTRRLLPGTNNSRAMTRRTRRNRRH
jgi:hypothetical protein